MRHRVHFDHDDLGPRDYDAGQVFYARVSAAEAAEKWRNRTAAAAPDYVRGIERVERAPGVEAARAADAYLYGVQSNVRKFQQKVAAVSLDEWKAASVEKGGQRLAGGVQAAVGKMESFMEDVLPHIDRGRQQLASMPKVTIEDAQARAAFWIRHMASFRSGGDRGR